jgi:hypothetical protein
MQRAFLFPQTSAKHGLNALPMGSQPLDIYLQSSLRQWLDMENLGGHVNLEPDALEKSYRPYNRKILNPDEGGANKQHLPSTQREMIQSRQSVFKLNKDTGSLVAKQILCKPEFVSFCGCGGPTRLSPSSSSTECRRIGNNIHCTASSSKPHCCSATDFESITLKSTTRVQKNKTGDIVSVIECHLSIKGPHI